jgi:hypothetical protein
MSGFGPHFDWQGAGGWVFQMRGMQIAGLQRVDLLELRDAVCAALAQPEMVPGEKYEWARTGAPAVARELKPQDQSAD